MDRAETRRQQLIRGSRRIDRIEQLGRWLGDLAEQRRVEAGGGVGAAGDHGLTSGSEPRDDRKAERCEQHRGDRVLQRRKDACVGLDFGGFDELHPGAEQRRLGADLGDLQVDLVDRVLAAALGDQTITLDQEGVDRGVGALR